MASDIHYPVASASVANGSKNLSITGNLTSWLRPNHKFGNQAGTCWAIIDGVGIYSGGSTPVTLAENWGGSSLTNGAAQIEITNEGQTLSGKVVSILTLLQNGILQAIAGLFSAVDGDTIQWKNGLPTNRSPSQLADDLVGTGKIVGTTQPQTVTGKISATGGLTGLPAPSASTDAARKAEIDALSAVIATVSGYPPFGTPSAGQSSGLATGAPFFVYPSTHGGLMDLYTKGASSPTYVGCLASPDSVAALSLLQYTDYKNYPCFKRYNSTDLSTLATVYDPGYYRGNFYRAFKEKTHLINFDDRYPVKVRALWKDVETTDAQNNPITIFRLILDQWDGVSAWVTAFDSSSLGTPVKMSDLNFISDQTVRYRQTISGKTVDALIDLALIPPNDTSQFSVHTSTPEMVFKEDCFEKIDQHPYVRIPGQRLPTFSFMMDDGNWEADIVNYAILRAAGIIPGFGLNTNALTPSSIPYYIKFAQEGASILSHSVSHPRMYDPVTYPITSAQVIAELVDSKNFLEAIGFTINGWVSPYSQVHSSFMSLFVGRYAYAFTEQNGGYWDRAVDPIMLSRVSLEAVMNSGGLAAVYAIIDTAIAAGEFRTLYIHNGISPSDMAAIAAYVRTKEDAGLCVIQPPDEAVQYVYKEGVEILQGRDYLSVVH